MKSETTERVSALRRALLEHYDMHHRPLPWRGETDPYRILVSEVMLQQTRVETVEEYYEAWIRRFPDLEALAGADPDDVLKAWEGLGYYRRARNLHRAARCVRERPDRSLPRRRVELRDLPGVGEYTAGAVASIAFGEAVPAVDGNVRRVLARLFDVADPKPAWLRRTAAGLLEPARPGDWNQALMELGATVCTPRRPRCSACPVSSWCEALKAGTQEERPAPVVRRAPPRATFAVAVLHHAGHVLLERRPEGGLLGGMWAFPESRVASEAEVEPAAASIADRLGARRTAAPAELLTVCEHRFTHLTATYMPVLLEVAAEEGTPEEGSVLWMSLTGPPDVALPVAQRRIVESAGDHLAGSVA